ncbi:MAG TPA: EamA family transporter [Armatimonadota bacterium]
MSPTALIFAALAMLLWGASPLFDKLGMKDLSPLAGLTIRVVAAAAMVAIYSLAMGTWKEIAAAPRLSVLYLIGSAVFGATLGQAAYYAAIKHADASQVVPIAAAYPLVTLLLAVPILREGLTVGKGVGVLLVVAGVSLIKGWAGGTP